MEVKNSDVKHTAIGRIYLTDKRLIFIADKSSKLSGFDTFYIIMTDIVSSVMPPKFTTTYNTDNAILIKNKHPKNQSLINLITSRIKGVIAAKKYVLVNYNIERINLKQAAIITPGRQAPTVSPLEDGNWIQVQSMVCREEIAHVMDKLEKIENTAELEFVKKLFPHIKNYTAVYDHYGLLNHQAIMAHGIHLSSEERKLLRQRKVGISHCPNSNFALRSGVCNVRQLLNDGIKVGLGTDISGGHAKSMLDAIRSASTASRVIHMASSEKEDEEYDDNDNSISAYSSLTLSELTYLATMGGAELVNLQNVIGNFIIGKEFDALWVDPEAKNSPLDIFDNIDDALERIFEKFIFLGDERNLKAVFVKGRRVSGTDI
ncbi:17945_t:CDS:2 [Entrophospora sp. SA101]|nr:17945_t:CDS:2 [Entrophospora sp. SA101]